MLDAAAYSAWLNGDPAVYPNDDAARPPAGREGGCRCPQNFDDGGFYSFPQQCATCLRGYGPADLNAWARTLEYQAETLRRFPELATEGYWPVFDPSAWPFSAVLADPDNERLRDAILYCRFPSPPSTRGLVTGGGRGVLSIQRRSVEYEMDVFSSGSSRRAPACTSVTFGGATLAAVAFDGVRDPNVQSFSDNSTTLNVIGDALYYADREATLSLRSCESSWPFSCTYRSTDLDDDVVVACVDDALYGDYARVYRLDGVRVLIGPAKASAPSWWAAIQTFAQ